MQKFDVEMAPNQWVPRILSGKEKDQWLERLATRLLLCYREFKEKSDDIDKIFNQTPEEYFKLHEDIE